MDGVNADENCTHLVAAEALQSPNKEHKHVCTSTSKSIIFISSLVSSCFYCGCTVLKKKNFFFPFFFCGNTKEITPLPSSLAHAKIINAFQRGTVVRHAWR